METMDFFDTIPGMRGYRGDTFPVFGVKPDAQDLTGCSMRLVLEDTAVPRSTVLTKNLTPVKDANGSTSGFSVQLVSTDTADLCGTYTMHFIMTDAIGLAYRKLVGTLTVLDVPKEGS